MVSSVIALLATAAPVHFEPAPSCAELDAGQVRRLMALELRPVTHHDEGFVTRVTAECEGTQVRLRVDDPVSRKVVERAVELAHAPRPLQARLLALAAVELVTVSWTELVTHPAHEVEPATPPPPEETRADAAHAAAQRARLGSRSRILLLGSAAAPLEAPVLFGAGVRWSWERFTVLGFELDARFERGTAGFPLGWVAVSRAALGLGVHARVGVGVATLRAVALLRGGAVQVAGTPAPGSGARAGSGLGPWAGVSLGGAASLQLGAFTVELGLEAGAPLVGVVATVNGVDAVRIDRGWLGAYLALGLAP